MDHIPHVCRSFRQHLPAFPSFSFLLSLLWFFSAKVHVCEGYGWVPLHVFIGWGPVSSVSICSVVWRGFWFHLHSPMWPLSWWEAFLSLKPVFLSVTTDLLKLNPPPPLLFYDTSRITTTTCEMKKTPGPFFTILVAAWILYTPQLKCSERILGQLRSLLVRGIVLLLNWGDIHMLLISGKNSGESDKRALFIFSLFFCLWRLNNICDFSTLLQVSAQSPSLTTDDLYLEGRTSGNFPVDDEDGEDDGSGSGSGDYGKKTPGLSLNHYAFCSWLISIIQFYLYSTFSRASRTKCFIAINQSNERFQAVNKGKALPSPTIVQTETGSHEDTPAFITTVLWHYCLHILNQHGSGLCVPSENTFT